MRLLREFLLINAILAFVYGLSFMLIPELFVGIYNITLDASGLVFTRSFGGALVGIGCIVYYAWRSKDLHVLRGLLLGGLVLHTANCITDYLAVTDGTLDSVAYTTVIMHFLLAVGFLYFFIVTPDKKPN